MLFSTDASGIDVSRMEEDGRLLREMDLAMQKLKREHAEEIATLKGKLQWYLMFNCFDLLI